MNVHKKTLVLGASTNPARYSYMAINKLRRYGHDVVAIGLRPGRVSDVDFHIDHPQVEDLDTITLYLNANNQKPYYEYILAQNPKRIIFNPGAENHELKKLAKGKGIHTDDACTLVMLSTGQY
ncbi:MAG: CoA-binding protein [Ginsengibacter sp.]|jgi:hypothetical protein